MKVVLSIILMILLLFCCQTAWESFLMSGNDMMEPCHGETTETCETTGNVFVVEAVNQILEFLVISFIILGLFLAALKVQRLVLLYIVSIRDRYGGTWMFNKWNLVLKLGLLNPKLF